MASADDGSAKLSSLFNKKKKKKSTTVNANVIVKEASNSASAATAASTKPASPRGRTAAVKAGAARPHSSGSPAGRASPASADKVTKKVADLSLGKEENVPGQEQKSGSFQWAKQPKKYKNQSEGVAKTWAEQEERKRRINLESERAFPTLGADATHVQLNAMKAPETKGVETKNVWASLGHDDDEDSD